MGRELWVLGRCVRGILLLTEGMAGASFSRFPGL